MRNRVAAIGLALALLLVGLVGSTAAHAEGTRCYPPPCASSGGVTGAERVVASEPIVAPAADRPVQRSAVPFVVGGLLMVSLSLALIMASRLLTMARSAEAAAAAHAEVRRGGTETRPVAQLSDVH